MKRAMTALIALSMILLLAQTGWTQENPENSPPPGSRQEALQRITMLRIFKLTEMLELNEEDAARLFPVIQRYDRQFREIMEKKEKLMHRLRQELQQERPDEAKLHKLVDEILVLEREAMRLRTEQFKELKQILTAQQYAKYLIFDQRFREDLNRMLDDIRRQRPRRRNRQGPPPHLAPQ